MAVNKCIGEFTRVDGYCKTTCRVSLIISNNLTGSRSVERVYFVMVNPTVCVYCIILTNVTPTPYSNDKTLILFHNTHIYIKSATLLKK